MSAMYERDPKELVDRMNAAKNEGELACIAIYIRNETQEEHKYTKDAELMQRLRRCYAENLKRVKG
jgi:hypothetical protein